MAELMDNYWYMEAMFYQVYVRAFSDSNGDGKGDLRGLISKLDYLQKLGVDCLWLMPIYPSPLIDDGYDIADYYSINPDFGSVDDFEELVTEARKRDIRVISDLVLNHTSDQHAWFQESRSSRTAPKRDWYVWSNTDQRYEDARIIFLDWEKSNWAWDEGTQQYYWHRFYTQQPDLNFDNPEVQQAMINVMEYWLAKGVSGFRADAVPYLFEREGTSCENLPETHMYLKRLRAHMEQHHPDAIMLAEANQLPTEVAEYFGAGDEMQMAFHFPLMPQIYKALKTADSLSIRDVLERTPAIPDNCQWCTFLRNHDELTLEMVTPDERTYMWDQYAPEPRMRINLGIRRRLAPLLDNNIEKIMLANRILYSLPGAPIIYYGDEIGMGDNIWLDDRNGVRTPMQWDDSPNGGFSNAPADKLYAPVIDDLEFGYQRVNVAAQEANPQSLLNRMRRLVALRKQHSAVLARGSLSFIDTTHNPSMFAFVRRYADETFVIVHNLADHENTIDLDLSAHNGKTPVDVLSGQGAAAGITRAPYMVSLPAYSSAWLHLT
jgi:maltose alpha-D-glucosyltransferase / alpha-amylase